MIESVNIGSKHMRFRKRNPLNIIETQVVHFEDFHGGNTGAVRRHEMCNESLRLRTQPLAVLAEGSVPMRAFCRYVIVAFFLFILTPSNSFADPILHFSDIDSGPKTGNTDGIGSGAIVTIWGNYLGDSRGDSRIYIGSVEAKTIYYWKNADGTLPGGPADLKTSHKMQEVAFSIPSEAIDGETTIRVIVGGNYSNSLPFTVRAGEIKFIKSTGSDSAGTGSWSNPYATPASVFAGGNGKVSAGDIVYSVGVGSTSGLRVGASARVAGTSTNPIVFASYPNTTVAFSGLGGDSSVICNWYPSNRKSEYINFSKIRITASGNSGNACNAFIAFPYNRVVGLEITGPTVYGGYGGAITASGSAGNPPMGGKYLGIYMHDYGYRSKIEGKNNYDYVYSDNTNTWTSPPYDGIGDDCTNCTSVDRFQHLYYLSIRMNNTNVAGYEIGWNNLVDNPILHGLHVYDMGTSGSSFTTPIKLHHNYIRNQGGAAMDASLPYSSEIHVYNNIIVTDSSTVYSGPAFLWAPSLAKVKVWNNTVVAPRMPSYAQAAETEFRNNVFYDTRGVNYFHSHTPTVASNNLFHSTEGASLPLWYSSQNGDINNDPSFNDIASFDFGLRPESCVIGSGYDISDIVKTDFFGRKRKNGIVSIGAVDFVFSPPNNLRLVKE